LKLEENAISKIEDLNFFSLYSTDFNVSGNYADRERHIDLLRYMGLIPKRLIAPMFVLLDITSECNIGCDYCYNKSGCGKGVRMDRETMFRIAKELVDMKVFSVCVCGGEPSLHPDFLHLIRYFRENKVIVSSITNGFDLNDEIIKEMANNLAVLQVTLDGPDAEFHDRLRGKGSFERALDTIKRLKEHNLNQLRIAFTCTKKNVSSFSRMLDLCLRIGANDLRTMPLVPVGRALANKELWPSSEELEMVADQVKKWSNDGSVTSHISVEWGLPNSHIEIGLLYGYLTGVNISPEGYYKVTPYLPLAFGNAHKVTLESAWKLGLGRGWLIPGAKEVFESIKSVDDFASAYDVVVSDERVENGFLDYFPEVLCGR
jgi:MoaA/NifB/PqqE/SkfB family radical SAM enzyme